MKNIKRLMVLFLVSAALFSFISCDPSSSNSGSSATQISIVSAENYSSVLECHSGNLTYDTKYSGTGWVVNLKPVSGVTLGESGKYEVYTLFHYENGEKVGATWGYVTSSNGLTVDVTVNNGKVSFSTGDFALYEQYGIGLVDAKMSVNVSASNVTYTK